MRHVEEIKDRTGCVLATVVRAEFTTQGVEFFSAPFSNLQFGHINYPSGHTIKPHKHNPLQRHTVGTQEVLFIRRGIVRVTIYGLEDEEVAKTKMFPGDAIHFRGGGHSIEMLADTDMFEVKQGPYAGPNDKTYFDPYEEAHVYDP